MNPPSYHNVTSFDCNYFSNPGTFEGSKLKPHAFQEARRLRTFLRRRGITTVVYQVKNGSLVEYWVKKVGAPMFVQPFAIVGMPRWRRWTWWIQSTDRLAVGWRDRNDYTLYEKELYGDLAEHVDNGST